MSDLSLRELFEQAMQDPSARAELEDRGLDDLDDPLAAEALTHVAASLPPDVAEHFSSHTAAASPVPTGDTDEAGVGSDVGPEDSAPADLYELLASAPEPSDPEDPEPSGPAPAPVEDADADLAEAFGSGAEGPLGGPSDPAPPPAVSAAEAETDPEPGTEPGIESGIESDPLDDLGPDSPVDNEGLDDLEPLESIEVETDPEADGDGLDA